MEIIGLLIQEISALFLILAMGFVLVKLHLLKSGDSRILSLVQIYVIMPCSILKAFQIDFTPEVRENFILSFGTAIVLHLLLTGMVWGFGKMFRLDGLEKASVMYGNAGSLIIPIVMAILGEEWVIYASGFVCVQMFFMWTHGLTLIRNEKGVSLKKILLNINLAAIVAGLIFLLAGVRLPSLVNHVFDQLMDTMGPVTMIIIGMLLADVKWGELLRQPRGYLIVALKMLVTPLVILGLMKLSGAAGLAKEGRTILFISFLAVIAPCATTVTQMAQLYRKRPEYAGALNAMTTLVSILTMPLMTWLYFRVM